MLKLYSTFMHQFPCFANKFAFYGCAHNILVKNNAFLQDKLRYSIRTVNCPIVLLDLLTVLLEYTNLFSMMYNLVNRDFWHKNSATQYVQPAQLAGPSCDLHFDIAFYQRHAFLLTTVVGYKLEASVKAWPKICQ